MYKTLTNIQLKTYKDKELPFSIDFLAQNEQGKESTFSEASVLLQSSTLEKYLTLPFDAECKMRP